ncbi:MAG: SHOCT domain-containing protein [Solirubrobacterales bacterium]|nr:SHOCT domain-containing protein [Solirubrobacterales bacterium]
MEAERPHRGWVNLLTVLVGILTVLAILSTWVDRQVFNTDQWGETSVKLLKDPQVQSAVATYAVDELYANVDVNAELKKLLPGDLKELSGVAAGGLRQVADKGAKKALENSRVQALWQKANEAAHKTLIDVLEDRSAVLSTTGGQVDLELRPLIVEIATQVGLGSQAEKNIPPAVGNIHIVDSEELATAQRVTKLIHGLALISALLAMVLLAVAVWLSRGYRWITLIWLGVAMIVAAVIVLIIRPVVGGIVVDSVADPDIQPAAQAAWNIATDLLHSISWTVIWSSLVLFVIAWLISPSRAAGHTRRFLAVPLGHYPVPVYLLLGLAAFIFLITGAGDARGFYLRLAVVVLAGIGAWAFRRQLLLEYPDANIDGLKEFGARTADSASQAWSGALGGVTRIFGSRDRGEEAPAAGVGPKVAPGGEPSEATTGKLDATGASRQTEVPTEVLPADAGGRFELLERLGRLHESGVLSDEEFAAEKRKILGDG